MYMTLSDLLGFPSPALISVLQVVLKALFG